MTPLPLPLPLPKSSNASKPTTDGAYSAHCPHSKQGKQAMPDTYKQIIEILIDTPTGEIWTRAPGSPEFRDGTAKRYALEHYEDQCRLNSITNALDSDTLRIVLVADQ